MPSEGQPRAHHCVVQEWRRTSQENWQGTECKPLGKWGIILLDEKGRASYYWERMVEGLMGIPLYGTGMGENFAKSLAMFRFYTKGEETWALVVQVMLLGSGATLYKKNAMSSLGIVAKYRYHAF